MTYQVRSEKGGKLGGGGRILRLFRDPRDLYRAGMTSHTDENCRAADLGSLYASYSPEELQEAEDNLDRYLKHAVENYSWIRQDAARYARLVALTAERVDSNVKEKLAKPKVTE